MEAPRAELAREAATMALYVTVCLIAVLSARRDDVSQSHVDVLGLVWGTTLGLALAHWFAFRLSARLVSKGALHRHDAEVAGAQLAGASVVALVASVPVLLLPASAELDATRFALAALVAAAGFAVARSSGASTARSLVYAIVMLGLAMVVAVVKNHLAGH